MKLFPSYENDTIAGFEVSSNRLVTEKFIYSIGGQKKQPLINLNETATLAERTSPARKQAGSSMKNMHIT